MARQVAYAEATVVTDEDRLVSRSTGTFLLHRPVDAEPPVRRETDRIAGIVRTPASPGRRPPSHRRRPATSRRRAVPMAQRPIQPA